MTNRIRGENVHAVPEDVGPPPAQPWRSFLVSAPHRVATDPGDPRPWKPYGVAHARKVGSHLTACGQLAVSWPLFWTEPFRASDAQACPGCALAVGNQE